MKVILLALAGLAIGLIIGEFDHKYSTAPVCAPSWSLDMATDTWYNCRKNGT